MNVCSLTSEPLILVVDSSISKNQPRDFSAASHIKVSQLHGGWHWHTRSEILCRNLSDSNRVVKLAHQIMSALWTNCILFHRIAFFLPEAPCYSSGFAMYVRSRHLLRTQIQLKTLPMAVRDCLNRGQFHELLKVSTKVRTYVHFSKL